MKTVNLMKIGLFTTLLLIILSCNKKIVDFNLNLPLSNNWFIQQSSKINQPDSLISKENFNITGWYPASVPSTIMGILSQTREYKDIFVGDNFKKIDKSQFDSSWWFRRELILPALNPGQHVTLCFNGISYYANIWLNGTLLASKDSIYGSYRRFEIDITNFVNEKKNILAVEVFKQKPGDFGLGFVDWNPRPPDENMGLWREVTLKISGEVSLKDTYIQSRLNLETLKEAWLTIGTNLKNNSAEPVKGVLRGRIENKEFDFPVQLNPGEHKTIILTSAEIPMLHFKNPRLWWCNNLGEPNLYTLNVRFITKNTCSDASEITFGIRDVQSYINKSGYKGFKLNGKDILIKGAGWSDDIFLRNTKESNEIQVQYVKHMNLNTLRFEGIWGNSQNIYDLCDKYGIMTMVGWSCQWEWKEYLGKDCDEYGGIQTQKDFDLVYQYIDDQIKWLRNHPSIITWFMGSDKFPKPEFESKYKALIEKIDNRPYQSSAGTLISKISGPTGVKMNGPYEYVAPNYWYIDSVYGGAYGFNTETGPGPQIPVLESVKKMIPEANLWPVGEIWNYHCTGGKEYFNNLNVFNEAMNRRYGTPQNLDEYLMKSDVMSYEAMRAMYEAFRVNIPNTTGIIQWMLNSAWPNLYWHLYDYYNIPTSAYYAVRKANTPVQLIYNYGNKGVYAVNETLAECKHLKASIVAFDINSKEISSDKIDFSISENSSKKITDIKNFRADGFLSVSLYDSQNRQISDNFYWISDKIDEYAWDKTNWAYTPMKAFADYSALNSLPPAELAVTTSVSERKDEINVKVHLTNKSDKIAFFSRLSLKDDKDDLLIPVYWDDNYFSLLPGETRIINCIIPKNSIRTDKIDLVVSGWNIKKQILPVQQ
jgi:exo-1,4-beta-D-glucosaminidase